MDIDLCFMEKVGGDTKMSDEEMDNRPFVTRRQPSKGVRSGRPHLRPPKGNESKLSKPSIPSNHMIGCDLETYANLLEYRGYFEHAMKLREIASVIK